MKSLVGKTLQIFGFSILLIIARLILEHVFRLETNYLTISINMALGALAWNGLSYIFD